MSMQKMLWNFPESFEQPTQMHSRQQVHLDLIFLLGFHLLIVFLFQVQ